MLIRSTRSLGFILFSRPISILARPRNVRRVQVASARLGMHVHKPPNVLFHSSTTRLQSNQVKDKDPLSPEPSTKKALPSPKDRNTQTKRVQTPTDSDMEGFIPGFSKLGVDAKLLAIQSSKSILSTEIQKKDKKWKPGAYEALTEVLDMKEKEIRDADTWYWKALRSIAWGPTIVINFIIAVLLP